jgi:hypothetical protein
MTMNDEPNRPADRGAPGTPAPSDQYLWERTGTPDPSVERLESLLAPLRCSDEPLAGQAIGDAGRRSRWSMSAVRLLAIAATLALAAGAAWHFLSGPTGPSWKVEAVDGLPKIGSSRVASTSGLYIGQWLTTDDSARAKITVADIGTVTVQPGSRVRLVGTSERQHKLQLDRGAIHASIVAPPRLFLVETPAALAVDLGCTYDLSVVADGSTLLRVTFGWVELERNGVVVKVPRGAACRATVGQPPGVRYFEDAPPEFLAALARWETAAASGDLDQVIHETRTRDSLTLLDVFARLPEGADRAKVYRALTDRVALPQDVSENAILAKDPDAISAWEQAIEPTWR